MFCLYINMTYSVNFMKWLLSILYGKVWVFFLGFFLAVLSQQREQCHCRKECSESVSKLQKKNQELQRHLEKTCRQLQHSVREHKTAIQHLKGSAFKRPY